MAAGAPLLPETLALLDQAPCGLVRTDSNGVLLRANRTFCQWLGYEAGELVGQRRFQDLLTMGGRIFHQTHWAPLLQMQGSVSEVKLDLRHRDGSPVPMVMNAIRRQEGGAIVHDIAANVAHDRDIYEKELLLSRRRLEALVTEANRLQEEARDRALLAEQMVGIVSHDLRNPLSTILMGATLLARTEATPNQLRVLARISRATERANRLIADLLDFTQARLGTGLATAMKEIDLHAVVADSVDELAQAFPGRKLRHEREGQGACMADADRVAQLVGNLVANAMTYGSVEAPVTVTSRIGGQGCAVSVHNQGPAIPPQLQAELFKPMSRGTGEVNAHRSLGLGLFIVSEIAKAHGGGVGVESGDGGTLFFVTLCATATC